MKGSVARRISHVKHRIRELGIINHNKMVANPYRIGYNKVNAFIMYNLGWFVGAVCVFAVFLYVLGLFVKYKIPFLPDFVVGILDVVDMRRNGSWSW
ncbi:MAG: hypothetical protein WCV63_08320 [Negativicutes bacterium]|jgi:hypothetical protein